MLFKNNGKPVKVRIGDLSNCFWKTIREGETLELEEAIGFKLGLEPLKVLETEFNNQKVETKLLIKDTQDNLFFKELTSIKGIGKKTAKDILTWGTKEKLIKSIELNESLPFRNDIEELLRDQYGK